MSISQDLKQATKEEHKYLDSKTILRYLTQKLDANQYLALLKIFYGYYQPLEQKLKAHRSSPILSQLEWFDKRTKAHLLADDIQLISLSSASNVNFCMHLPEISTSSHILGVLYVLEGATLGGQVISNLLNKQISTIDYPKAFFCGYQDKTRQQWATFCDVLHAYDEQHPHERPVILSSARNTFVTLIDWIEQNQHVFYMET